MVSGNFCHTLSLLSRVPSTILPTNDLHLQIHTVDLNMSNQCSMSINCVGFYVYCEMCRRAESRIYWNVPTKFSSYIDVIEFLLSFNFHVQMDRADFQGLWLQNVLSTFSRRTMHHSEQETHRNREKRPSKTSLI